MNVEQLEEENTRLALAIQAIIARIDGEWDNAALVAFGPLSTDTTEDCKRIARNYKYVKIKKK